MLAEAEYGGVMHLNALLFCSKTWLDFVSCDPYNHQLPCGTDCILPVAVFAHSIKSITGAG